MKLTTPRLILAAADHEIINAELAGRESLAARLGADIPGEWPPPLNDETTFRYVLNEYDPQDRGWGIWYFLLRRPGALPLAIGIGGFKGPPKGGVVEIGYSVIVEQQRRGLATEACAAMIQWAGSTGRVSRVIAHTLVGLTPSIRVLEKLGFTFEGQSKDEDAPPGEIVIRYGIAV